MNNEEKYKQLITRFLSGEASEEEKLELKSWIDASEENFSLFDQFEKVWKLSPQSDIIVFNQQEAWKNIQKKIMLETNSDQTTVVAEKKISLKNYFLIISATAAILILAFILQPFITNSPKAKVISHFAQENNLEKIILNDSTAVFLKKGAVLSYNDKYNKKNRLVQLEGEAFFDVKSNAALPFRIETALGQIEVIGTSFNVLSDIENGRLSVSVISGKVKMEATSGSNESIILVAEEQGTFDSKALKLEKQPITDMNFLAWKTGLLIFEQTSLADVIVTLAGTFNLSIESSRDLSDLRLTARFNNEKPEDIFKTLSILYDLDIQFSDKIVKIK
jgi:transmembrane sensor